MLVLRPVVPVDRSVTVPAKWFTALIVIVEVVEAPLFDLRMVGFAVIVKSWTMIVRVVLWLKAPLVPVTVTV